MVCGCGPEWGYRYSRDGMSEREPEAKREDIVVEEEK